MPGHPFIIVEYPEPDTPLAAFTLHVPGTTVDLISEPALVEGEDLVHPSLVLIKGAPPADLDALLKRLAGLYRIDPLERDDKARTWMGRIRIRASTLLHNPGAQVVIQFQHRFGVPWTHMEQGTMHMRARVVDGSQAELLCDQMRRFFGKAGVDAQVEVREVSPKDYGVWDELVQRAIGVAP